MKDAEISSSSPDPNDRIAAELETLKSQSWNALVRIAKRKLSGRSELAEDVVKCAFDRLTDQWLQGRFKPESPTHAAGWLGRTVINLCLNANRFRSNKPRELSDEVIASSIPDPADLAAANELTQTLQSLLCDLPEPDATVLRLKYVEDYSYAEIAAQMATSVGTVGMQLTRARERMHQKLVALGWPHE